MNRRLRAWLTAISAVAVLFLAACTGGGPSRGPLSATSTSIEAGPQAPSRSPSALSATEASSAAQSSSAFHPRGLQVVEVAHLKRFLGAYNAGDLTSAIAQFSHAQPLAFSDCDYSRKHLVDGHGRAAVVDWLRQSLADHDRLTIGDIAVSPPDQIGVLGVGFTRRTGDAIVRAGHPSGITPGTGAKVKFDRAGLITEFNNGPFGAPQDGCRLP